MDNNQGANVQPRNGGKLDKVTVVFILAVFGVIVGAIIMVILKHKNKNTPGRAVPHVGA